MPLKCVWGGEGEGFIKNYFNCKDNICHFSNQSMCWTPVVCLGNNGIWKLACFRFFMFGFTSCQHCKGFNLWRLSSCTDGRGCQMPLHALFQAQEGTQVEILVFLKLGWDISGQIYKFHILLIIIHFSSRIKITYQVFQKLRKTTKLNKLIYSSCRELVVTFRYRSTWRIM